MTETGQRRLRATLTFSLAGDLEGVFLVAGSDQEEALLRKAIAPILRVIEWRQRIKRALLWAFNRGLLSQGVTQRLFDLFRLQRV